MSAMTARVSAYSCLCTVTSISDRLGGRLVLKLFLQPPEDDLGGVPMLFLAGLVDIVGDEGESLS